MGEDTEGKECVPAGNEVEFIVMTVADRPSTSPEPEMHGGQRFVFEQADWLLYEHIGRTLQDQHVFVTYYKGRLEVVTVSYLHERIIALIVMLIRVLAEETETPLASAGMTTLRRKDLAEAIEPDASFYTVNESRMRGKKEIDLSVDPPPDLAVEVEATSRLGARKSIYRDLGVAEVWQYGAGGLTILSKRGDHYEAAERSPTFPQISPQEIFQIVTSGLDKDETKLAKSFRQRVRDLVTKR